MTTIAEVAQVAGVGVGTVSRVLNGSASVSEATRRRVLDVIAELGYEPNAAARALSTGRTGAIGVVAPFFTEPSVIERIRGITHGLAAAGYQLILFDVEGPEQREAAFRAPIGRVDGLVAITLGPTAAELDRLTEAGLPLVLIDQAHDTVPAVTVDDVEGGRLATEHLLALGHERIAFAGTEEPMDFRFTATSRRREGYAEALAAAGLEAPERELVLLGAHGREGGAATGRRLLDRPAPPTAVFAVSDMTALGVLEAADELGLRVPEDLSVVGFDDVEVARYAGLTTVAQPLRESGAHGAELLLDMLEGRGGTARRLPLELVVRATTAESARPAAGTAAGNRSGMA